MISRLRLFFWSQVLLLQGGLRGPVPRRPPRAEPPKKRHAFLAKHLTR